MSPGTSSYHSHDGIPCSEFFCGLPHDRPEPKQIPPELQQEFERLDREIKNRKAAETHDLESDVMQDETSTRPGIGALPTYEHRRYVQGHAEGMAMEDNTYIRPSPYTYNMDPGPVGVHDIRMFCLEQADHGHTGSATERAVRQARAAVILEHYILTGEVREPDSKAQHGSGTPPLSD